MGTATTARLPPRSHAVSPALTTRQGDLSPFRQQMLLIEVRDGADVTTVKGMLAITETACLVSPGAAARVIVTTNNANPTTSTTGASTDV
jgi:hypothetical protein